MVRLPLASAGDVGSIPGWKALLEKEMTTHSSILAWEIPWPEKPGGYSPWGRRESDTTEQLPATPVHMCPHPHNPTGDFGRLAVLLSPACVLVARASGGPAGEAYCLPKGEGGRCPQVPHCHLREQRLSGLRRVCARRWEWPAFL